MNFFKTSDKESFKDFYTKLTKYIALYTDYISTSKFLKKETLL